MLRFVLADLRRHWPGALAIALIVALAAALGVTVTLQERALRLGSARAAAAFDLVVGAPGSETQLVLSAVFLQAAPLPLLPPAVLAGLAADPLVAWAAPVGFGDFADGRPIVGTTAALVSGLGGVTEGRLFGHLGEAVVGAAVPVPLGVELHPVHGELHERDPAHAAVAYRVAGRMAATGTAWDRAVLVPIETVWRLHDPTDRAHDGGFLGLPVDPDAATAAGAGGIPAILVKPRSFAAAYKLRQAYRTEHTLAVFPGEILTRLYGLLGDARLVLALVATGAQGLVAAAILVVMVLHVAQRRRQIGALRAFGASRRVVVAIVWLQAYLVIGLGLAAGYALGVLAALAISRHLAAASGFGLPVEIIAADGWALLALLAASAALACAPALLAYRQSPAQALRG